MNERREFAASKATPLRDSSSELSKSLHRPFRRLPLDATSNGDPDHRPNDEGTLDDFDDDRALLRDKKPLGPTRAQSANGLKSRPARPGTRRVQSHKERSPKATPPTPPLPSIPNLAASSIPKLAPPPQRSNSRRNHVVSRSLSAKTDPNDSDPFDLSVSVHSTATVPNATNSSDQEEPQSLSRTVHKTRKSRLQRSNSLDRVEPSLTLNDVFDAFFLPEEAPLPTTTTTSRVHRCPPLSHQESSSPTNVVSQFGPTRCSKLDPAVDVAPVVAAAPCKSAISTTVRRPKLASGRSARARRTTTA
jgi:hypothetical protein